MPIHSLRKHHLPGLDTSSPQLLVTKQSGSDLGQVTASLGLCLPTFPVRSLDLINRQWQMAHCLGPCEPLNIFLLSGSERKLDQTRWLIWKMVGRHPCRGCKVFFLRMLRGSGQTLPVCDGAASGDESQAVRQPLPPVQLAGSHSEWLESSRSHQWGESKPDTQRAPSCKGQWDILPSACL